MVSEYLNQIRSVEELDKIIEHDREVAAKIAKTVFNREVSSAIANISEINQIANARIMADSQVASAKMMSDAEVISTLILSKAELAALEVQQQLTIDPVASPSRHDMIVEIGRNTHKLISKTTIQSVEDIHREAKAAIDQLQENATKAIEDIHSLADEVAAKVEKNAQIATKVLRDQKAQDRTQEDVIQNAETQAQAILDDAARSSAELRKAKDRAISDLNIFVDKATHEIQQAVQASERRILTSRDSALALIDELIARHSLE